MKILSTLIWCVVIAVAALEVTRAATLRLYRGSLDKYIDASLDDLSNMYPYIDKSKTNTVFASESQESVDLNSLSVEISAYIKQNTTNVMLVIWEKESKGSLFNISVPPSATTRDIEKSILLGKALVRVGVDTSYIPSNIGLYGFLSGEIKA